eukprot:12427122-Karenia_brevis.AAC.1
MGNILRAASIYEVRLAVIKPSVDTCRQCRAWQKQEDVVMPSIDMTTDIWPFIVLLVLYDTAQAVHHQT